MFRKKEDKNETSGKAYVEKYIEGIERLYKAGGGSLVLFGVGGALIVLTPIGAEYLNLKHLASNLIVFEVMWVFILILGAVIYLHDVRRKEMAVRSSFEFYHELVKMLWQEYLNSYKGDLRDSQFQQAMKELHRMLEISIKKQRKITVQQGAPANADKRHR